MNHRERFFTAIEHGKPDRVPITDLGIDPPLVEQITGIPISGLGVVGGSGGWEASRKNLFTTIEAHRKLDFDAFFISFGVLKPKGYAPKMLDHDTYIDEWGRVMQDREDVKTVWWKGGTVETPEDLDNYIAPDANAPGRMEILREAVKEAKDEMCIFGMLDSGFITAYLVRGGIDKFIIDIYRRPWFIRKLMAKIADAFLEWAKLMLDEGVDGLGLGDDYCDTHGPLIPLNLFRELELPYLKRIINLAKKRGVPVLKHTDGNAYPILDYMIDAGISGLHPMEPGCMDIGDVKKRYGDRIFLMGNVDCRHILPYGSEEEVRKDVRRCIDAAGENGGFVLSSSNSLHANVKVKNVYVMVDEAKRYGIYPLKNRA